MTLTKEQRERLERFVDFNSSNNPQRDLINDVRALLAAFDAAQRALRFYAKHEYWMALTDDLDAPHKLLVANGDTDSVEGWAVAEAAIAATNAQAGGA